MNKNIKISLLLASLLSPLYAQDTISLEPLTIDSTAIKTDELRSTDAVEVYTAQDIEKAHVQNLYEFLNEQTSVVAMPSYGNPFTQLLDMHGFGNANGYQNIVVTLNGRKLNNIDGMPQLLSSIAPNSIERIEIIKSSGVVMNGDGANAGTINIITKQNNDKEIGFYGGTYGMADGSFYIGQSDDKLSLSASGEAQKFDGIRSTSQGEKDKNRFSTGNFNLVYTPNKKVELRLGAGFSREEFFYGGSLSQSSYESNPNQTSYLTHQLSDADFISGGLSFMPSDETTFKIDASHEKKLSAYAGSDPAYYDYNSAKASFEYEKQNLDFIIGADIFDGERTGGYYRSKLDKNNLAAFATLQYRLNSDTFKLGYRTETISYKYDKDATHLTQNDTKYGVEIGYNRQLDSLQSLFANYSHAFTAPVIDAFFDLNTGAFNGFISPMDTDSYTLGYNNIQKENKFKLSIYYIDLTNEIYLDPTNGYFGTNTNIDKSHKYGLDVYDKYIFNQNISAALNYNYVQAIIDREKSYDGTNYAGKELPGVSNHTIKATLNYLPNEATTLSLIETYRSEAYAANDFSNNFSQKQDPYMTTDISATYSKKSWEIFAKINNLFNQKNGLWIQDNAIYPVNFTTTAIAGFKLKY